MNDRQERFIKLLENIFELDKSDLDFGIYRIMNIRRAEIEKFFKEGLPKKITETLAPFARADSATIRKRMAEIETSLGGVEVIAQMPAAVPMVAEYNDLKKKLAEGVDISALESDVYSALYSFFSRYYDDGDFISKRRYKEGVYAIPYEGEEVKLYWANQDQYYIKTSENFKDYTFKTNEADGITVHFRLVDATTEQNNNKEADDKKRTFMLYTETEENPDLHTFEYDAEKRELIIRFIYDIPANPKTKWHEANMKAINAWIAEHPEFMTELLRNVSVKQGEHLSLIEKHLKGYVAKNTFDYFIHKDLGGFLRRELDFFIKNEIMHIDDIDTETETRVEAYLGKVRAIKRVGGVIIDFLAQVEDFQKRLWLKKKFVVETNYCITLDKIDERFYEEIAANEAQVKEWIEMYAIDEIKADMHTLGFSLPLSVDFLKQNQNLIVDTRHFTQQFRDQLLASIDNLDEQTNGVMINADNFHALKMLSNLKKNKIKCLYFDPPYNTSEASLLYKNNYKHSSWISMIANRFTEAYKMLENDGVLMVTIDDEELYNLKLTLDDCFGKNNYIGTIVIQSNPRGRSINSYYATCHEYCLCYAKSPEEVVIVNDELTEAQAAAFNTNNDQEEAYRYLPFRRSGGWSEPQDRPNSEFPLFFENGKLIGVGGEREKQPPFEYISNDVIILNSISGETESISIDLFYKSHPNVLRIMPIDSSGKRRVWRWSDRKKILLAGATEDFLVKFNGSYVVYLKDRIKSGRKPKTMWIDSKYDSSSHGTNLIKSIFSERSLFGFPKSLYSTQDSLHTIVGEDKNAHIMDIFGGSGTTGHAVINLNREDDGNRKYILVEMGEYFDKVTKPRIQKVIYASDWKDGKPKSRTTGVSHIMKYMRLESYEDALSNIELKKQGGISLFGEDYLINYMLKMESKDSLLNIDKFRSPFDYKMRITEKNECRERSVDVCETFNYLIGLRVMSQSTTSYYSAERSKAPTYDGAVELRKDDGGAYGFRQIEGLLSDGRKALVIWRTITDDILASNAALDAYFSKYRINPAEREYDIIYVNGDNNLENLRTDDEHWKVVMIEKDFNEKMWEE